MFLRENSMHRKIKKNLVLSVISKIIIFVLGLLIPRLIISSYGSEINGVLSTSKNILTYLALIEGGISGAAMQGLYGPIGKKDYESASRIIVATRKTYRKYFWFYLGSMLLLAAIFPLIVKSELNYFLIFGITAIEGLSSALTFYFASTLTVILSVDGRDYAAQLVQLFIFLLSSTSKIVFALMGINILFLQCAYLAINIIQIAIYILLTKHYFNWIDWHAVPDYEPLKNRNKFLINTISWTVFSATDTLVISIMCGFKMSSVYAIYLLIFANLNILIQIIYSSFYFALGQKFKNDNSHYIELHDRVESFCTTMSFFLLTTAFLCTIPFLKIYTKNITDVSYIDVYLPILFFAVYILTNLRLVCGNLINISNNPKLTNLASILESVFNVLLSFLLAFFMGIYGVLVATIITLGAKTIFIIIISNKKILYRSPFQTFYTMLINSVISIVCFCLYYILDINNKDFSIGSLVLYGLLAFSCAMILFGFVNFFADKNFRHFILFAFRRKIK